MGRSRFARYLELDATRVREWLPEIEQKAPNYFHNSDYDVLAKMQLVASVSDRCQPRSASTSLPQSVIDEFPDLAGKTQQEATLKLMRSEQDKMDKVKELISWMINRDGPKDSALEQRLLVLQDELPSFDRAIQLATLCVQDTPDSQKVPT